MDFALDDEQQMVVQTVRRFVDKDVRAWAADADREAALPARLAAVAGDLGFFLDGLDAPYAHLTRALRGIELGRGCAAMAALLETNVEPALAVERWGDAGTKAALRASLEAGGLTTTARDSRGRVTLDGDRATGVIGPVPALGVASHVLLIAGDTLALVETAKATRAAVTPNGWRCAQWGTLTCADTPVTVLSRDPAAAREVMTWYRTGLAARAVGVAIAAMEHAEKYGQERVQFGQPIGTFESLVRLRDDAETGASAARLMALQAAWLIDQGQASAADAASRARVIAGDVVARATIDAVQIFGGYGFVNDFPVEKLMRDARAFEALGGDERFERVLARKAAQ
jgi:alkylation response protein AidB-like acyl-CoA dehydrogenase